MLLVEGEGEVGDATCKMVKRRGERGGEGCCPAFCTRDRWLRDLRIQPRPRLASFHPSFPLELLSPRGCAPRSARCRSMCLGTQEMRFLHLTMSTPASTSAFLMITVLPACHLLVVHRTIKTGDVRTHEVFFPKKLSAASLGHNDSLHG